MSNPNKALGTGLENRVVERATERGIPAKRQPGSGVFAGFPNDVALADLLVECKVRSTHPSMNEMLGWLAKVQENARKQHFWDGILVYNRKGSRSPKVLLDLDLFLDILKLATEENCDLDTQNCEEVG